MGSKKVDLKEWRRKSDNFIGSSKDRDKLFEEIEKEKRRLAKQKLTGGKG